MVKVDNKQMMKLLGTPEGVPQTIKILGPNMMTEDDFMNKFLFKKQIEDIEKNKKKGKGIRLTLQPTQLDAIKKKMKSKKVSDLIKSGAGNKIDKNAKAQEVLDSRLPELAKTLFHEMVRPVVGEVKGKMPRYSKPIEIVMIAELSRHPEIITKLKDINNISDMNLFVKSIIENVKFKGLKKGSGLLSDGWAIVKKIAVKTVEVTTNIIINTSKNVWTSVKRRYSDPLNVLRFIGNVIEAGIETGPLGALTVIGVELGEIAGRAFLMAVKQEIAFQLPENVSSVVNNIISVMDGVRTAKSIVKDVNKILDSDTLKKVTQEVPQIEGAVDVAKDVTKEVTTILGEGTKNKKGRPAKKDKKKFEDEIDKYLKN